MYIQHSPEKNKLSSENVAEETNKIYKKQKFTMYIKMYPVKFKIQGENPNQTQKRHS